MNHKKVTSSNPVMDNINTITRGLKSFKRRFSALYVL